LFILNPHTGIPIYRQLIDQIRRLIASGQLQPGAELPSIRELALRHAINPMTVSKVYSLLEAEGVLERRRGRPMTVANAPRGRLSTASRLHDLEPQLDGLTLAAKQLELDVEDVIAALRTNWEKVHA